MLNLLAQAEAADRAADAIFAAMDGANSPGTGSRLLIPAGFEGEAERASDLRRRARHLRAEADEMRAERAQIAPQPSPRPAPAAIVGDAPPAKPVAPVETAETVASRILKSDSVAPDRAPAPQGLRAGAADPVEVIVARIMNA